MNKNVSYDEVYQDELQEQVSISSVGVQEMDLLYREDIDPKILDNNMIENNKRNEFINDEGDDILEDYYSGDDEDEFVSEGSTDLG